MLYCMREPTVTACVSLSSVLVVALLVCSLGHAHASFLDHSCTPPISTGGMGWCGPDECATVSNPDPGCVMTGESYNYQSKVDDLTEQCKTCTQSADTRCSASALAGVINGLGGSNNVKFAFCNDQYLNIIADGAPAWTPNLDDVPNPPGGWQSDGVTACVTRSSSITPRFETAKIPLSYSLLSSASTTNNMATFPDGSGDCPNCYLYGDRGSWGLPSGGPVGITVQGQQVSRPDERPSHFAFCSLHWRLDFLQESIRSLLKLFLLQMLVIPWFLLLRDVCWCVPSAQ